MRTALDLPIVGTVPAIKPAAALSATRAIGVLGTDATVRQPYVDDLAARFAADCAVVRHGAAALVAAAEAELRGDVQPDAVYADALAGLLDQPGGERIDVVVNACTHFPLVADRLSAVAAARLGRPLTFVDGGPGIARRIVQLTGGQAWEPTPGAAPEAATGIAVFTGDADPALGPALSRHGLTRIETL